MGALFDFVAVFFVGDSDAKATKHVKVGGNIPSRIANWNEFKSVPIAIIICVRKESNSLGVI